jgi:hypothetical protein
VRAVWFGKVRGTAVDVRGEHFLWVTTPAHPVGRFPIRVVTGHGVSVGGPSFTFGVAPSVAGLTPRDGPIGGGTKVTITGAGFGATTRVVFGGVAGTRLHVLSPTSLTVLAPEHAAGTVHVRVVSPFGWSRVEPADRYTFVAG